MRIKFTSSVFCLLLSAFFIISCNKNEQLNKTAIGEYYPTLSGKYIIYRVDSTVFTNFGRTTEIHRYRVKHVIDSLVTDNSGRPSYRVFRYINDSLGTGPWVPNGSYLVTPTKFAIEVIEDNLRVIKLNWPAQVGNSWKGNRYLPTDPYGSLYSFSNDDNMADWDFSYEDNEVDSVTIMNQTYRNVVTVLQDDESYNVPITDPHSYAARSYGLEMYSKNIGMVFREFILWEQQPNPIGTPPNITYDPYRIGFGIKMWMIAHN